MQINPNSSPALVSGVGTAVKTLKRAATEFDSTALSHIDELKKVLRDQEDVRPDVVKKAAVLVSQNHWPPAETIRQVAKLLAMRIGD